MASATRSFLYPGPRFQRTTVAQDFATFRLRSHGFTTVNKKDRAPQYQRIVEPRIVEPALNAPVPQMIEEIVIAGECVLARSRVRAYSKPPMKYAVLPSRRAVQRGMSWLQPQAERFFPHVLCIFVFFRVTTTSFLPRCLRHSKFHWFWKSQVLSPR